MASKPTKGKDGEAPEETTKQLLHGNKCLEKEAQDTQEQSQSYLSCGAKLRHDPPDMLITLNDQNRQDLAQIQAQQEELIPRYTSKEQEVRSALQDTEASASLLDTELEQLEPYKEHKVQAEQKVKALEKELRVTRIRCAEETHAIRSQRWMGSGAAWSRGSCPCPWQWGEMGWAF
uniref:DUF4515 domain-containing protein n=1 Tax=Zosterops lateralis melanops TaxID=1220523 RepID=A0A8D2P6E7_ZOSLA